MPLKSLHIEISVALLQHHSYLSAYLIVGILYISIFYQLGGDKTGKNPTPNDNRSRSLNSKDPVGQAAITNHENQIRKNIVEDEDE